MAAVPRRVARLTTRSDRAVHVQRADDPRGASGGRTRRNDRPLGTAVVALPSVRRAARILDLRRQRSRPVPHETHRRDPFTISTDPALLDIDLVHDYLSRESY